MARMNFRLPLERRLLSFLPIRHKFGRKSSRASSGRETTTTPLKAQRALQGIMVDRNIGGPRGPGQACRFYRR